MEIYTYVLQDIDGNIRYVGVTNNIDKRYVKHIYESIKNTKSHKCEWIRCCIRNNYRPLIRIIDTSECREDAFLSERYWISRYKFQGYDLTNGTEGGDGNINPSKETRLKMSLSHIGKVPPNKGKKHSSAHIEKLKQAWKNRPPVSIETRKKLSILRTGKKRDPAIGRKISIAKKGKPNGRLGYKLTEEHKRKIGLANSKKITMEACING